MAAWMVHALGRGHEVATLTADEWSPADTNAFYGTSIPSSITRHVVGVPWRWLAPLPEDRLTRLRMCSVLHRARALASRYDLLISADNFAAFPDPGIQYVHFPALLQPPPARMGALVRPYFALCDWLLGARWTDATRNLTLANSEWTAEGLRRLGEVAAPIVLHPPVVDPGPGPSWEQRDDTFLCIGRFTASKRIELAIAIVERVRARSMPGARLVIVGSAVDGEYTDRLRASVAAAGDWVEVREDLSRSEINALMHRSRYGIHAMIGEHFGMATAEMARAGCVVFAHDSGGSPEVLNHDPALLWTTGDEAVEKIASLAGAAQVAANLRAHTARFSADAFATRLLSLIATHQQSSP